MRGKDIYICLNKSKIAAIGPQVARFGRGNPAQGCALSKERRCAE